VFEGAGIRFYSTSSCSEVKPVVAIRRASLPLAEDRVVCPEGECLLACTNWEVEAPILLLHNKRVRTLGYDIGRVVGKVRDLPVPPVPYEDLETGKLRWTRFALDSVLQDILPWQEAKRICRYPEHCEPVLMYEGAWSSPLAKYPRRFCATQSALTRASPSWLPDTSPATSSK